MDIQTELLESVNEPNSRGEQQGENGQRHNSEESTAEISSPSLSNTSPKTNPEQNDFSGFEPGRTKIYQISKKTVPIYIVSLFLIGAILAIGHHLYYSSLRGRLVGNVNEQQWALRSVLPLFNSMK